MTPALPADIVVLERGWLSANNILCLEGDQATLVDSGYVTHAAQTVALVRHALAGRQLRQVVNTHVHSDHIGGNAALQQHFDCALVIPAGAAAAIDHWNEEALLLAPLCQQSERFRPSATIAAGNRIRMGEREWTVLAVPGHDNDALAFFNADDGLLIAGDALWENGFGLIFPELLGSANGLADTRATLEMLGRLPIRWVLPGHGRPFQAADEAIRRGLDRLARIEGNGEGLAWHGIRTIASFLMLERQRLPEADFIRLIATLPFTERVNRRFLQRDGESVATRCLEHLLQAGALRRENGWVVAA